MDSLLVQLHFTIRLYNLPNIFDEKENPISSICQLMGFVYSLNSAALLWAALFLVSADQKYFKQILCFYSRWPQRQKQLPQGR
jgi:hypothetical protein